MRAVGAAGVLRNPATPRALGTRNNSRAPRAYKGGSRYESAKKVLINREFGLDPAAQEAVQPGVHSRPVMDVALDVLMPFAGAFHAEARVGVAGPAVHLGVGDLG